MKPLLLFLSLVAVGCGEKTDYRLHYKVACIMNKHLSRENDSLLAILSAYPVFKQEGDMNISGGKVRIEHANVGIYIMQNNPSFTEYMFRKNMDSGFVYSTDSGTRVVFSYHDTINIPFKRKP